MKLDMMCIMGLRLKVIAPSSLLPFCLLLFVQTYPDQFPIFSQPLPEEANDIKQGCKHACLGDAKRQVNQSKHYGEKKGNSGGEVPFLPEEPK